MTTLRYMSSFWGINLSCWLAAKSCKPGQMPVLICHQASPCLAALLCHTIVRRGGGGGGAWAFHIYYRGEQNSAMNVGRPSETWIAAVMLCSGGGGALTTRDDDDRDTARVNLNLLGLTDIRRRATDVSVNRRSVRAGGGIGDFTKLVS